MTAPVRTTCPYCGVGCGVLARRLPQGVEITGDPEHPASFGRLCSKGSALHETLGSEGRLLYPRIAGRRASWEEAVTRVASAFARAIREHGPDAVAFYVSGQLLTEDYYVANKLMKGFIGSANIDTNSRLCMASAAAGHRRAFGADLVPGCYEDFELADLIVLVGSNTAWCHPVLYQRILAARERRPELKIVVIDPRRTPTCEIADLHLPVRAGTDVWLFDGLLSFLHRNGFADDEFIRRSTSGVEAALEAALAAAGDACTVAEKCGINLDRLIGFYELFARTPRVVTAFSQGVNQSSSGTDKVSSIINCHLLTGRIGRPGMGPFSITGQPNAMGGREVGGMAHVLAAHMEIGNPAHRRIVQELWRSPRLPERPGLKAVELFDAVRARRIRAIWIMATNPVVSLPDAARVREALERCEFVAVSDCVQRTDTTALAHVLLPAAAWGEKDGTVTNSERRISRQRAFLQPLGEARPDWWIICEVARRMGFAEAFPYTSAYEIFREHARLSALSNAGSRVFDLGGLADLTADEYESLAPVQWPLRAGQREGTARLFSDGRFPQPDGRAHFTATRPCPPVNETGDDYPFVLNTGRIRDQWHTMTRTGLAPSLSEHLPEPFVDMHAQDALLTGIRAGELARVSTRWGSLVVRARTSGEIARGTLFVPIHWSASSSSDARAGSVVNPVVDPESGEPELKHTPARVEPFPVDWYGCVFSRRPVDVQGITWWTLVRGRGFLRYELAGRHPPEDFSGWSRTLLGAGDARADYLEYADAGATTYRAALIEQDMLVACLFVCARPELPSRTWVASLFQKNRIADEDRAALLAGRPLGRTEDVGPLVCACHGVGRTTILRAIESEGLDSITRIGARTRAGTNCGSCVPELRALLSAHAGGL